MKKYPKGTFFNPITVKKGTLHVEIPVCSTIWLHTTFGLICLDSYEMPEIVIYGREPIKIRTAGQLDSAMIYFPYPSAKGGATP